MLLKLIKYDKTKSCSVCYYWSNYIKCNCNNNRKNTSMKSLSDIITKELKSAEWQNRKPFAYINAAETSKLSSKTLCEMHDSKLFKVIPVCDDNLYIITLTSDNWTVEDISKIELMYWDNFIDNTAFLIKLCENAPDELKGIIQTKVERLIKIREKALKALTNNILKTDAPAEKTKDDIIKELIETEDIVNIDKYDFTEYERRLIKDEIDKKHKKVRTGNK